MRLTITGILIIGNAVSWAMAQSSWTVQNSGTNAPLYSVTWTGNQLVAVGEEIILTSPDGINWTVRASMSPTFQCILNYVTWTGSQLVALDYEGAILTSPDGITWTTQQSGTRYPLTSVTWTGNKLVAVGALGTILTSP